MVSLEPRPGPSRHAVHCRSPLGLFFLFFPWQRVMRNNHRGLSCLPPSSTRDSERDCHTHDDWLYGISDLIYTDVSSPADSGYIDIMNFIHFGSEFFELTNNFVEHRRMHIRWSCVPNPMEYVFNRTYGRFIVAYDRCPEFFNGALVKPTLAQLLGDQANDGSVQVNVLSHQNRANEERFLFLVDEWYILPPTGYNGSWAAQPGPGNFTVHYGNWDYNATTTGATITGTITPSNAGTGDPFTESQPLRNNNDDQVGSVSNYTSSDNTFHREFDVDLSGLITVVEQESSAPASGVIWFYNWIDIPLATYGPPIPTHGPWEISYVARMWYDTERQLRGPKRSKK